MKGQSDNLSVIGVFCLLSLISIVPFSGSWNQATISRLFSYVSNYQKAQYAQVLQAVQNGRLIVPLRRGYLSEGDSPVTFGWQWGVETINGPYNQGDPKFFKYTVHLEWEGRWLDYQQTRENLMQEGAAGYIFIRFGQPSLVNSAEVSTEVDNSYGTLLVLDEPVDYADHVTPILLDVTSPQKVTEFFNILVPGGYRLVFVDAAGLDNSQKASFEYVLTDDMAKVAEYQGKTVFLLNDTSEDAGVAQAQGVINISAPVTAVTDSVFYHEDEGDVKAWGEFETSIAPGDMYRGLKTASQIGDELLPYIGDLQYEAAGYQYTEGKVSLNSQPGFTLVKDSYFPYWQSSQGTLMQTTQGFMLVYSDSSDVTLSYEEPPYYAFAGIVTIAGLGVSLLLLAIMGTAGRRRWSKTLAI